MIKLKNHDGTVVGTIDLVDDMIEATGAGSLVTDLVVYDGVDPVTLDDDPSIFYNLLPDALAQMSHLIVEPSSD